MNSIISFRGKPISTSSRGRTNALGMTGAEASHGKDVSRRYDCEDYLDCLFSASVVNASRLPCKGCNRYSPKYAEEDRKDIRLWV